MQHPNAAVGDISIFHFPASFRSMKYSSLLANLARDYKKTHRLNIVMLERARDTGNPWVLPMGIVWIEYILSGVYQRTIRTVRNMLHQKYRKFLVR